MRRDPVLGWDLGGAHLKGAVVDEQGRVVLVRQLSCPLWRGLEHFHDAAAQLLETAGEAAPGRHAVTLTGELVDLFESRREGVRRLVDALCVHLPAGAVTVYGGPRGFLSPAEAVRHSGRVASANWLATASLLALHLDDGVLVDVGSTTTDVIPFAQRRVRANGFTDYDRLRSAELVYTGVVRTPVMAMARRVPVDGQWVPLMAEHFATAADVYRVLGRLPEHADKHPSADNGPKTRRASARRLARMTGCDLEGDSLERWRLVAAHLAERQLQGLQAACERVLSRRGLSGRAPLVGAGVGRFVVRALATRLGRPYVDFCDLVGGSDEVGDDDPADCAPAVAVARLAQEPEALP